MKRQLLQKLAIGAALLALVTPSAFAQTGSEPEPGVAQVILTFLGLS
jgi:hypothetical protein